MANRSRCIGHEHFVDARHQLDGARHSEHGVQLVDVTVRFDARVILGDAAAAEQSGVAGVAGLRVDLHGGGMYSRLDRFAVTRALLQPEHRTRPTVVLSPAMDITRLKDITIIGGGPTGLFALFYAGMRGATAQIVDALPELGGQLTALYPEKYIFDVGGFPKILAKDLVKRSPSRRASSASRRHLQPARHRPRGGGRSFRARDGDGSVSDARRSSSPPASARSRRAACRRPAPSRGTAAASTTS